MQLNGNKYFPVKSSILSSEALMEEVLSKYLLNNPIQCQFFKLGVNDTYLVRDLTSSYYLRVYKYNWRTKEDIESELECLNYLSKNNISVSMPIKNIDGVYLNEVQAPEGIRYVALFTDALGVHKDNLTKEESYILGKNIANIHITTDKLEHTYNRFHIDLKHLVDEPLKNIEPLIKHRHEDYNYFKTIGEELKIIIEKLLPQTTPLYGICHGDIHLGNINFKENGISTMFDFDCFGYGFRAYDIAVYRWHQEITKHNQAPENPKLEQWNKFLEGYNEERKLTTNENEAINAFIAIRHIWVMGLHSQLCPNVGYHFMNDVYFDNKIKIIKEWIKSNKILRT